MATRKLRHRYRELPCDPRTEQELKRIYAAMERYPRKPGETWNKWCQRAMWYDEIDLELKHPVICKNSYDDVDTTYTDDVI